MLISCTVLKNSIDKLNENTRESYRHGSNSRQDDGRRRRNCTSCVILGVILLIIEVAALYFALDIAVNTTKSGAERFVHVLLAVTVTTPYLLFSVLLNPKASSVLKNDVQAAFKMCGASPYASASASASASKRSRRMRMHMRN